MSYLVKFIGLGSVAFQIHSELAPGNCGIRGLGYIRVTPENAVTKGSKEELSLQQQLYTEFHNYIMDGVSKYKIQWERNDDPFWSQYSNTSQRAMYILSGAMNNDETPYPYPSYQTMQFCHYIGLPHFEMMQNPFHSERKSAVYGLCVPYKKREPVLVNKKVV